MTDLAAQLDAGARLLHDAGLGFAVVGGLAVSARTEPRFTRDVDLAVAVPDDLAVEKLVLLAGQRGYRTFSLLEHDVAKRIATVRLQSESGILDLLFASSGIEAEIVRDAEELELLPGVRVPVARVPHLMAQKLLARDDHSRPQDIADLTRLRDVATATELEEVRALLQLIETRGFNRKRPLLEHLALLLQT
jgi:predicted nucleotidyltransferase